MIGCTSSTVRPTYGPLPLAEKDTVVGTPSAAAEAAREGVVTLAITISRFSASEGYLETRWFDPRSRRSRRENTDPAHLVRLRVWTDLVTPRETQVAIETVRRTTIDPSVPDREVEIVADSGTAGDSLTRAVAEFVRRRFSAGNADSVRTTSP